MDNKERLMAIIDAWEKEASDQHRPAFWEDFIDRIIAANLLAPESLVDNPVYRIVFADQDVGDHIIWIEGDPQETRRCALESFAFHQQNWNCKLMVEIANRPEHAIKFGQPLPTLPKE